MWQPFLTQAATENDARLRLAAAEALGAQPAKLAAAVVGPLLADEDAETRSQAAGVVLSVISGERVPTSGSHGSYIVQLPEGLEWNGSSARLKTGATNAPPATREQIAAWHTVLQQKAGATPDALTAAAIYVTGQSNADLPVLQGALEQADKEALARLSRSAALAAILPRLPWPEGKPVVERLSHSPALFLRMVGYANKSAPGLRQFLFDPHRFRAAVEPASLEELQVSMPQLLSSGQNPGQKQVSLVAGTWRMEPVVTALLDATNAAWRAAAVYAVGSWADADGLSQLERALQDTNGWVRAAAVPGLARTAKDRATLEQRLGPLMADPDKHVTAKAAIALLEPETRNAAGLDYSFEYFQFENIHAFPEFRPQVGEQRPLYATGGQTRLPGASAPAGIPGHSRRGRRTGVIAGPIWRFQRPGPSALGRFRRHAEARRTGNRVADRSCLKPRSQVPARAQKDDRSRQSKLRTSPPLTGPQRYSRRRRPRTAPRNQPAHAPGERMSYLPAQLTRCCGAGSLGNGACGSV